MNIKLGLIKNPNKSNNNHLWEGFTRELTKSKVKYKFFDPESKTVRNDISKQNILFTIDDEVIPILDDIVANNKLLVLLNTKNPKEFIHKFKDCLDYDKFLIISQTKLWKDSLQKYFPKSHVHYTNTPCDISKNTDWTKNKTIDISFIGSIIDIELFKNNFQALYQENIADKLQIITDFCLRNPDFSVEYALNYVDLTYFVGIGSIISGPSLVELENYIISLKRIHVLKALSLLEMTVWGNNNLKNYISDKHVFIETENPFEAYIKSKIIVNVDDLSFFLGISQETIMAIGNRCIIKTNTNRFMETLYEKDKFDFYYSVAKVDLLPAAINQQLNLYKHYISVLEQLNPIVQSDFSWNSFTQGLLTILKENNYG